MMNLLYNSQLNVISVLYCDNAMSVTGKQQQRLINSNLLGVFIGAKCTDHSHFPL